MSIEAFLNYSIIGFIIFIILLLDSIVFIDFIRGIL